MHWVSAPMLTDPHMNRRDDQWNHFIFVKSRCHTYVILHRSWRRGYSSLLPLNTHPVFSLCTLYLTPTVPPGVWSAWPTSFPPLCLCSPFSSAPFITTWENMWAVTWFHGCCPPPDNCSSCQCCVLCFHLFNKLFLFLLYTFPNSLIVSFCLGSSAFRGQGNVRVRREFTVFLPQPVTDHFLFRPERQMNGVCARVLVC